MNILMKNRLGFFFKNTNTYNLQYMVLWLCKAQEAKKEKKKSFQLWKSTVKHSNFVMLKI
jgi:hypothetical protein